MRVNFQFQRSYAKRDGRTVTVEITSCTMPFIARFVDLDKVTKRIRDRGRRFWIKDAFVNQFFLFQSKARTVCAEEQIEILKSSLFKNCKFFNDKPDSCGVVRETHERNWWNRQLRMRISIRQIYEILRQVGVYSYYYIIIWYIVIIILIHFFFILGGRDKIYLCMYIYYIIII